MKYSAKSVSINRLPLELCLTGIASRLNPTHLVENGASPIFALSGDIQGLDNTTQLLLRRTLDFQTLVYEPTLNYARRYSFASEKLESCDPGAATFLALTAAVRSLGDGAAAAEQVRRKCQAGVDQSYHLYDRDEYDDPNERGDKIISASNSLDAMIWPSMLMRYGEPIYEIAPMWEFSSGGSTPKLEELETVAASESKDRTFRSFDHLRRLRDYLNVTIAQQNMLMGDLLFPILSAKIENGLNLSSKDLEQIPQANWKTCDAYPADDSSPTQKASADYFNAVCLLNANPTLRINFITYWVKSKLKNPRNSPTGSYRAVRSVNDLSRLQLAFDSLPPLKWTSCGGQSAQLDWCIVLAAPVIPDSVGGQPGTNGVLQFPLPTWEVVAASRAQPLDAKYRDLIDLRASVESRLTDILVSRSLSAEERSLLFAGELRAVSKSFDGKK